MTYYVYDNRVFDDQDDVRDYRIDNPGGTTQRFDTLAQANAFLSDSRSSFGRDEIPSGDDIVEAQRLMDAFLTGEGMAEAAYSLWGEETLEEILDRVMAQNTQIAPADREAVRSNLGFVIEQARNEAQNIVDTMVDNPEALDWISYKNCIKNLKKRIFDRFGLTRFLFLGRSLKQRNKSLLKTSQN